MSGLTYRFKSDLGDTLIVSWAIILDRSVPSRITNGNKYFSKMTAFCQANDQSDSTDKNAWGEVFPGSKFYAQWVATQVGGNPRSIFKLIDGKLGMIGRTWTADNGNSVKIGGDSSCTFYNKTGQEIYRIPQMFVETQWGGAWFGCADSINNFLDPNKGSEFFVGQGQWKDIGGSLNGELINCKFVNRAFWEDPFRACLLLDSNNPPKPVEPNNPFGPDTTGPDSPNKPDGEYDENGEFDDVNDKIDDTQLPPDTAGAVGTGFISLYTPTFSQLNQLASYLWSPSFLDTIHKLLANPFDVIMNLHTMPFIVPQGATQPIQCGNVPTTVNAPLVAKQFYTFDFGTVKIPKFSATYLDYSPYTSYKITLPYMSTYALNTDEITGKTLGLKYHIDIATGDTVAVISVDGQDTYTFTGNCATNIPITQGDYTNYWTTLTKAVFDTSKSAVAIGTGGVAQASESLPALSSAVETVIHQKPDISTSGVLGSNFGNFGCLRPYITKIKPNLLIPEKQQNYTGWASYFVTNIGDCTGFNQFKNIQLNNLDFATEEEKNMIINELESGVVL